MSRHDSTVTRLELIAAKAKQLAEDLKKSSRLWDGELEKGLNEIREQLSRL